MKPIKYKRQKRRGMTLVELIISMGILGIVLVAFINMFVFGAVNILNAGNKGVAYMSAQRDVDTQLANNETISEKEVSITFGAKTILIPGGVAQSTKSHASQSASQEVFIPYVPTIESITPSVISEGQSPLAQLSVLGTNTHFNNGTYAQIYDFFGNLIYTINSSDVILTNETEIVLNLPSNNAFLNSKSNYVIRIITPISAGKLEIARAKFSVTTPKIVLVTNGGLYVSASGDYWLKRSSMANFPSFDEITSGFYGNERYLAADSVGRILTTSHRQNWNSGLASLSEKMNDVFWSANLNKYFLVSDIGKVWSSVDLSSWTLETQLSRTVGETIQPVALTAISGDNTGRIIIGGNDGSIVRYDTVNGWSSSLDAIPSFVIKDVYLYKDDTQSFYLVVGSGGKVFTSTDGLNWIEDLLTPPNDLNSITYDTKNKRLIVDGEQGKIFQATPVINVSTGKLNWTGTNPGVSFATLNFTNVFYHMENDKVVISTTDTVYTFTSNYATYESTVFTGEIINDIFGQ
ncbi:MAG TPA: hypothetical protein DCS67_07540 [Clostridiales bacterium UBA8960]|nr:hypothetical protein [Clostridiales bacterium UBA8960]